jgi:putative hydrolase of the HAD superfamily
VCFQPDSLDVVFLDAAGTLFEVRGSVGRIYSEVARRYGVDASPHKLEEAFTEAFRRKSLEGIPPEGGENRTAREKRWWLEIVQEVFAGRMPDATLRRYFEEVFEAFRKADAWRLFRDTHISLERLRGSGYRLGIISNFDSRLSDLLINLGIGSLFEHVTISWCVGAAKPDSKIFRSALQAMNVPAARAMHVGDSLHEDFAGAQQAGLAAVLLDRRNLHSGWKVGWRIRSLSELCDGLPPK